MHTHSLRRRRIRNLQHTPASGPARIYAPHFRAFAPHNCAAYIIQAVAAYAVPRIFASRCRRIRARRSHYARAAPPALLISQCCAAYIINAAHIAAAYAVGCFQPAVRCAFRRRMPVDGCRITHCARAAATGPGRAGPGTAACRHRRAAPGGTRSTPLQPPPPPSARPPASRRRRRRRAPVASGTGSHRAGRHRVAAACPASSPHRARHRSHRHRRPGVAVQHGHVRRQHAGRRCQPRAARPRSRAVIPRAARRHTPPGRMPPRRTAAPRRRRRRAFAQHLPPQHARTMPPPPPLATRSHAAEQFAVRRNRPYCFAQAVAHRQPPFAPTQLHTPPHSPRAASTPPPYAAHNGAVAIARAQHASFCHSIAATTQFIAHSAPRARIA